LICRDSITMMVAAVDGDPLLPPEHMHHATCVSNIISWDEEESKHLDASLFFTPKPPGTEREEEQTTTTREGGEQSIVNVDMSFLDACQRLIVFSF